MNYIILAIPVFFALIAVELLVTRILERHYYTLADSLSDLGCGAVQQLLEVAVKTALFAAYVGVYNHRLVTMPAQQAWVWVVGFLGVDFLYYWFHRLSHEVNAFWAAHVVHHQSEEYNLSVALRQGALQGWFSWVFYLPLALLGFPPLMYLTLTSLNTVYQFWIHTRVIGRLGPLEWVLNTPSNHRVHHGRNPKYIDRNHGGTLIVWDRLFGTYHKEEEEPVYGITSPLRSWNPVWANLHVWVELCRLAKGASSFQDRIRLFLKPPGWRPGGEFVAAPEIDPASPPAKFETHSNLGLYAVAQFAPVLALTAVLLRHENVFSSTILILGSGIAVWSFVSVGALLEGKTWGVSSEFARLVAIGVLVVSMGRLSAALGLGGVALSATWLWRHGGGPALGQGV